MTDSLFRGFAHLARLPSILLSNSFPSATKGGAGRNAGKVTPSPGRHVASSFIFSDFLFLFEVVTVCNVAPYFQFFFLFTVLCLSVLPIVIVWMLTLDVSLQDSKMLQSGAKIFQNNCEATGSLVGCGAIQQLNSTISRVLFCKICVKSLQPWQEEPHYIGTLAT